MAPLITIAVVCNDSQPMLKLSIIGVWLNKCRTGQDGFDPFLLDVACGNCSFIRRPASADFPTHQVKQPPEGGCLVSASQQHCEYRGLTPIT
jgi:hypothetical protein